MYLNTIIAFIYLIEIINNLPIESQILFRLFWLELFYYDRFQQKISTTEEIHSIYIHCLISDLHLSGKIFNSFRLYTTY